MERGAMPTSDLSLPPVWERALLRVPLAALTLIVVVIALAKQGIRWPQIVVWENASGLMPESSAEPLSYGFRLIGFLLGFSNSHQYLLLAALVSFAALCAIAFAIQRHLASATEARVALILAVSGPIVWSLASNLGRVDSLLILGSALLIAVRGSIVGTLVATLLMVLAHPEQSLVAITALLVLSIGPAFHAFRRSSLLALGIALTGNIVLWVLAAAVDAPIRQDQFASLVGASLGRFLTFAPLIIYSGLGVLSIIAVFTIITSGRWANQVAIAGAILLIPLTISAITLDQTRVFVGVSTAAVLALTVTLAGTITNLTRRLTESPVAFWLIVTTLMPAVHIAFTGDLVAPLRELHEWLIY